MELCVEMGEMCEGGVDSLEVGDVGEEGGLEGEYEVLVIPEFVSDFIVILLAETK